MFKNFKVGDIIVINPFLKNEERVIFGALPDSWHRAVNTRPLRIKRTISGNYDIHYWTEHLGFDDCQLDGCKYIIDPELVCAAYFPNYALIPKYIWDFIRFDETFLKSLLKGPDWF